MTRRKDYDPEYGTEENDFDYDEELEKDWGETFDDLDSSFWENYYGGPDCELDEDSLDEEDEEYEESGKDEIDEDDVIRENEEEKLEDLLKNFVDVSQKLEDLKFQLDDLKEEIASQLKDDEIINFEGFRLSIGISKAWEFSGNLQELIKKVNSEKKREIESGIATEKSTTRYLKGQKTQAKVKEKHPRAYMPWSEEEDKALLAQSNSGVAISEISQIHKRQRGSILARLKKIKQ